MTKGELTLSRSRGAKAQKRLLESSQENLITFHPAVNQRRIELIPKSRSQEELVLALLDAGTDVVVTAGPAGTGKTYLAMTAAVRALRSGACDRIVLTRPAVEVENEKHGFLPGDLMSKMEPWTRPLMDVLREHYHPRQITSMLDLQQIEISPLAFMRGRTFKNAWIIADEMQNATPDQVKMLLTRIGEHSKIIITGDIEQTDRVSDRNGLRDLVARLRHNHCAGMRLCEMTVRDIQRHPLISRILELYQD